MKIKYLSLDVVREKRESLIKYRNDLLLAQRYKEANNLLKELEELNIILNNLLYETKLKTIL